MAAWPLSVAIRYTRAGTHDRLVSFISLISILGLVLGVAVLVIVLSVMNGFERELRERVLGVLPHGVVYRDAGFADWEALAAELRALPAVEAVAPMAEGSGLVVAGREMQGVVFFGIEPGAERDVSIIDDYMTAGSLDALEAGAFRVVIGERLAQRLGVSMGDRLTLVLPDAQLTLAGPLPRTRRFDIVGLFRVGADADKNQLYVHLDDAGRLLRRSNVEALRLRLVDLFDAPGVLLDITRTASVPDLYASSWMRRYGTLYDAIALQKTTMFLLLLILIAVAAFNVVSNLIMTVDDKRSDIAILRTLGATPGRIMAVFVMHGALVGAIGVLLGCAIGSLVAVFLGDIYGAVDAALGVGLMDEYFIQYLPSSLRAGDVGLVAAVSFLICLVATLYPARRAANARPVEALQYDA